MEYNNQNQNPAPEAPQQPAAEPQPTETPPESTVPPVAVVGDPKGAGSKKRILLIVAILVLIAGGAAAFFVWNGRDSSNDSTSQTPTDETNEETEEEAAIDCGSERWFADPAAGLAFCYPNEWGEATLEDAKLDPSDTGYRQTVSFADKPGVIVGGVSEDWSTTVGRDGNCSMLSNTLRDPDDYNTEWHNISGGGMAVDYAQRDLVPSGTGYSLFEYATNLLEDGVCLQGQRVIDGSRYRVASAAWFQAFNEEIATPKAHMDNPNVLIGEADRAAFDALVASLRSY